MTRPLAGRNVALIHPAWHSCGTYRVVLGQIAAYRALGAKVFPVAISVDPGFAPEREWMWRSFVEKTPELNSGERFFGGAPFHIFAAPHFLRSVLWPYLHGDQAIIRTGVAARAHLSSNLSERSFDLVHCNHFFLMPVAQKLARAGKPKGAQAPILLDSHDLQARQFILMNERMPWLSPRATYEAMLAQELEQMGRADLLLHLNVEEGEEFQALLPQKTHLLLYPAVPDAPTGPGGEDIVLVASNNSANVESVIWFLREVAGRVSSVAVKIAGNVDAGVRSRAPDLYRTYKSWFLGRVEDPGAIYARARLALLPTISGHGLSIKTVEALASGLPLIATSHAFRGMDNDARKLKGVTIADHPRDFADALREAAASSAIASEADRCGSAARAFYEANFSAAAYQRNLSTLAARLLERTPQ
jgi:glycosyltransferase involved in cell wall biosynthesis